MRYYISGQITNNPTYKKDFERAEFWIRLNGDNAISPTILDKYGFLNYAEYMKIDLALLEICDGIYMLNNWKKSKEAKTELAVAKSLGKKIIFESEEAKSQAEQTMREFWVKGIGMVDGFKKSEE